MITKLIIEHFKRFERAEIELGHSVVFVGPNNAGKTTALQALALWDVGLRTWLDKREGGKANKRTGVTINRRDLTNIPVPSAKLLWHNLKTHYQDKDGEKPSTAKHYIVVTAEGVVLDQSWKCSLEFYYANEESIYCRLRMNDDDLGDADHAAKHEAMSHRIVYLPPMSGLADREYRKEPGEVAVLIGQGQTAQVLRNLCWQLFSDDNQDGWALLCNEMQRLFHIAIMDPKFYPERGELAMEYRERTGALLDISSSGRGCQQVMLLLSYMLANPSSILLLDEPDAHLEILRQRDIYNVLTRIAEKNHSQIVAASHSEIMMQEAAERDVVVSFVGNPHRIDQHGRSQLKKALESIPVSDYYVAQQKGWMLYLEGATDLSILTTAADRLNHPASAILRDSVPVHYLDTNRPQNARDHFFGLRHAKTDLPGIAIFDRLEVSLTEGTPLTEKQWNMREIENYFVTRESLHGLISLEYPEDNLIDPVLRRQHIAILDDCVREIEEALALTNKHDPWGPDIKVTDNFLDPLFKLFYKKLGTPQRTFKRDYHQLAMSIPIDQIHNDITVMLDEVHRVALSATPQA